MVCLIYKTEIIKKNCLEYDVYSLTRIEIFLKLYDHHFVMFLLSINDSHFVAIFITAVAVEVYIGIKNILKNAVRKHCMLHVQHQQYHENSTSLDILVVYNKVGNCTFLLL